MGLIGDAFKLIGQGMATRRQERQTERQNRERMALLESLDFEPMYASQTTPTYRRTESPVARAYLESFLLGSNPNATFSGSPNAAVVKAAQQRQENTAFGTPAERVARQRALQNETPWAVQTPTRQIRPQNDPAMFAAKYPELAQERGITPELLTLYQKATGQRIEPGTMEAKWLVGDWVKSVGGPGRAKTLLEAEIAKKGGK